MNDAITNKPARPKLRSRKRKLLFRLLAVCVGMAPFVFAELLFTALDWGRAEDQNDPFAGFHSVRPLFVLNEARDRFEIPKSRHVFFRPDGFAAKKAKGEFRIFCLGGSTVQGRPYAIETSFTTWLELALEAADSERNWEVVNCGGVSYASYRLVPILEEVLEHQPDLIVLCSGHNEFLEDRTYDHIKDQSVLLRNAQHAALKCRTYCVLRDSILRLTRSNESPSENSKPLLPTEVDARLDYRGGLALFHRDDSWRDRVLEHYRFNMQRMVRLTSDAGVPLILINPVSNLRDTPPFKSEHRNGLHADDLRQWDLLWRQARDSYATNLRKSIELFHQAAEIDGQYAALQYQLGVCYDILGDFEMAARHFVLAKDNDICPLRMFERQHKDLREIAASTDAIFVDVRSEISSRCRGEIADDSWLVDHVHPSIQGHQLIAGMILERMASDGFVSPSGRWEKRRDALYERHRKGLGDFYFHEAERRLEGLRRWATGRATLERPPVDR